MPETPDGMEMPCLCKCGNWFEVTDGWAPQSTSDKTLICVDCHEEEIDDLERESEIADLEDQIADAEITITDARKRLAALTEPIEMVSALRCVWCGETLENHEALRNSNEPVPRMPCLGLKSGFRERS